MSARTLKGEALAGILGGGVNFGHGDIIRVAAQAGPNAATTIILRYSVTLVYEDGEPGTVTIDVTLANDRVQVTGNLTNQDERLATIKGASVNLVLDGGTSIRQRGVIWTSCFLDKGTSNAVQMLFNGYLYNGHQPSFPIIENWADGPGNLFTASGADAAAGAEVADTVPAGAMWRIYAIEVVLVTDGTAANRFTNLVIDNAGSTITRRLFLTEQTAQTATLTRTHHWSPGTDANNTASITQVDTVTLLAKFPMSLQFGVGPLDASYNIRTITSATVNGAAGMVAGDNYGVARYIVEEWLKQRT